MRRGSRGLHLDYAALHARYVTGETGLALAAELGIDAGGLYASWKRRGLPMRTGSAAARLRFEQRPDLRENIRAAQAARRGAKDPMSRREQRARTREARGLGISDHERRLAQVLTGRGVVFRQQAAIGPYNVDFLIGTVALDIDGGGHNPRVRQGRGARRAFLEAAGLRPARIETWRANWIEVAVHVADA